MREPGTEQGPEVTITSTGKRAHCFLCLRMRPVASSHLRDWPASQTLGSPVNLDTKELQQTPKAKKQVQWRTRQDTWTHGLMASVKFIMFYYGPRLLYRTWVDPG